MEKNNLKEEEKCNHDEYIVILDPIPNHGMVPVVCGKCEKAGFMFIEEKIAVVTKHLKANFIKEDE